MMTNAASIYSTVRATSAVFFPFDFARGADTLAFPFLTLWAFLSTCTSWETTQLTAITFLQNLEAIYATFAVSIGSLAAHFAAFASKHRLPACSISAWWTSTSMTYSEMAFWA